MADNKRRTAPGRTVYTVDGNAARQPRRVRNTGRAAAERPVRASGSAVPARKMGARPERRPDRMPERRPGRTRRTATGYNQPIFTVVEEEKERPRYAKRKPAISLGYAAFAVICTGLMIMMLVNMMGAGRSMRMAKARAEAARQELQTIQEQNESLMNSLNRPVDLSAVFTVATGQMGMVVADEEHIVYYESKAADSVTQYESIPNR